MASMTSNIDYATTYFTHDPLTKIHGEPTFTTLKNLKDELRANASSVPSNLGGGLHGHLGLILTPAEYANVLPTAYLRPTPPPPLTIAPGTPVHTAMRAREDHQEAVRAYKEVVNVEQTLKDQVMKAVKQTYWKTLQDQHTQRIAADIPAILDHLFTRYGDVDHVMQSKRELEIYTYLQTLV